MGTGIRMRRDERTFARILFNECRATVLAMREIRAVNPAAELVQTEDLGTIYSSPALGYQAAFENERRWLTWDLLCGRVDGAHPLHSHLLRWGVSRQELDWLCDNACPPDVIGIDHYVTSDRYLDEDLERYPGLRAGGNGRDIYIDVEAVRVREQPGTSLGALLAEADARYGLPIVLTEVHLGCAPVEQIRWVNEAWQAMQRAKSGGIDARAVTAWALLGCHDWDTLLTRDRGHYEPGAFAVTKRGMEPTPLADFLTLLAAGRRSFDAGTALGDGWWRRPQRLIYPPLPAPVDLRATPRMSVANAQRAFRARGTG